MAHCTKCGAQMEDNAQFCPACGASVNGGAQAPAQAAPQVQPWDHTAEFDKQDISDNKVLAMLGYIMGWLGIVLQLLASNNSPYVRFHMRQALKLLVVNTLMGIVAVVLVFTLIVPIAAAIMYVVFEVIAIICFFQVCQGKAVEPAIIRSLGFLK